jgi:hypothetical protein
VRQRAIGAQPAARMCRCVFFSRIDPPQGAKNGGNK